MKGINILQGIKYMLHPKSSGDLEHHEKYVS